MVRDRNLKLTAITANNAALIVPAGYMLEAVIIKNNTANAVTGGIRIGTAAAGAQVVTAQAVAANAFLRIADAALLLAVFSTTADQILYVEAVTAWNSASLDVWAVIRRLDP